MQNKFNNQYWRKRGLETFNPFNRNDITCNICSYSYHDHGWNPKTKSIVCPADNPEPRIIIGGHDHGCAVVDCPGTSYFPAQITVCNGSITVNIWQHVGVFCPEEQIEKLIKEVINYE